MGSMWLFPCVLYVLWLSGSTYFIVRPARRSARLAIQNRASRGQSTSATIQLSPVAGSPALSINPDEVIDLITPPHPHPAPISSTGTAFTSPTPSQNAHSFVPRAGPLDLFGDLSDSNNRVSHSAPVVPWMSSMCALVFRVQGSYVVKYNSLGFSMYHLQSLLWMYARLADHVHCCRMSTSLSVPWSTHV